MRVAFVTAGAAGMYCGTCMQDNTVAAAMIRDGLDVALIPVYTPTRTDEADVSLDRVFYGALNVYLEQKTALFRHTPKVLDRVLKSPKLLEWVSRRAVSTEADELVDLTLSVLMGRDGRQRKELDELVAWLRDDWRPDVVHLSNTLLSGLAGPIREALGVPVSCSIQGEDLFLDDMAKASKDRVVAELRRRAADVDGFVAASSEYADRMASLLAVPRERIHHVPLGIRTEGFAPADPAPPGSPWTVGYLARMCPAKGLDTMLAGFRGLVDRAGDRAVRLRVAGYLGAADREFVAGLRDQVRAWGIEDRVDWVGEVDRDAKAAFLQSLHVLSVPTRYLECKGIYVLEAWACGVPVVQPGHGSFPEMIEASGGGIIVEPDDPEALADGLWRVLSSSDERVRMGRLGRRAVETTFSDATAAANLAAYYRRHVDARAAGASSEGNAGVAG